MGIAGGMLHGSRAARQLGGTRRASLRHTVTTPAASLSRRSFVGSGLAVAMAGAVAEATMPSSSQAAVTTEVVNGLTRVKYQRQGWDFWQWQGHRVHYIADGPLDGEPVLLIHGYGASAYHWRWQIPALAAAGYRVYAMCLLGFGWSEKALTDYSNGRLWSQQIGDFITQVVAGDQGGVAHPVVLAGNSLGGYACMGATATRPELVRGLVLLNAAGPFEDPSKPSTAGQAAPWYQPVTEAVTNAGKRMVLFFAFQRARQPQRIKEVLEMVYVSDTSIDEDLVDSIVVPATDPQAAEVFFRINSNKGPALTVNSLLADIGRTSTPMLLLWGDRDPWITPKRAEQIMALYPAATKAGLQSGHCPHDDSPVETNAELLAWLQRLPPVAAN